RRPAPSPGGREGHHRTDSGRVQRREPDGPPRPGQGHGRQRALGWPCAKRPSQLGLEDPLVPLLGAGGGGRSAGPRRRGVGGSVGRGNTGSAERGEAVSAERGDVGSPGRGGPGSAGRGAPGSLVGGDPGEGAGPPGPGTSVGVPLLGGSLLVGGGLPPRPTSH